MKKLLFFVIFAFFFAGCGSSGLAPDETLTSDYAYVVMGLVDKHFPGSYSIIDIRYVDAFVAPGGYSFSIYRGGDGLIQKVNPGMYAVVYRPYNSFPGAAGMAVLGTFVLEPGKINYAGSFTITSHTTSSNMQIQTLSVRPIVTYEPEAVKEALKITYPSLAQDIDTKFVVKPLR